MPNYDFTCQSCNHEFSEIVSIDKRDDPLTCPNCGKKKCRRGVSAVRLSYSGFKSPLSRTSDGWNDVLKKVKRGSGKANTIRTK